MERYRKEIQTKLLKYGGLYEIIKKNGIKIILDIAVSKVLSIYLRFYRFNDEDYGLPEALSYPKGIDRWSRYAHVVNEIKKTRARTVLEVGSGGQGISPILTSIRLDYDIFLLDIRRDAFKGLKNGYYVTADGCSLPFKDKAFDVVISIDTVEHIPKMIRHNLYRELKRSSKKRIIFTCPIQSSDGLFQGMKYDLIFQYLHERTYGVKEPNTAQHIAAGHLTLEEIKGAFPDSTIYGYKNCDVWLKYMLFSRKPLIGLFSGLLYYLFWKKKDDKPPYWGAIIVSN